MAGAGYKLFNTGDVLTAAQVNTYLQEQVVMVFANAAARTTALASVLSEGMVSYLKDTNATEVYDGFSWVSIANSGDITAVNAGTGISGGGTSGSVTITNSMATAIDAKGDLIAGTGADAFDRLAVGSNGDTLVADSAATTGLRWQGDYAAGKNKVINGDFAIWQRGTSVSPASSSYGYGADRWRTYSWGSATSTISQQSFTAGTAPVVGYEGQFFLRINSTNTNTFISQPIENVRTLANQTVTVSFWAKAASAITSTATISFDQNFGSGGSGTVNTAIASSQSFTTSWARYSYTGTLPSISGKTIGTGSYLDLIISLGVINNNFDIWGVQVEAGSVATAFQTATGTLQGELAACQRYYFRWTSASGNNYEVFAPGNTDSTTAAYIIVQPPVTMRVKPTSIDATNLGVARLGAAPTAVTATIGTTNMDNVFLSCSGTGLPAAGTVVWLMGNNSNAAYLGLSAEL
jgi:hypothetical protein